MPTSKPRRVEGMLERGEKALFYVFLSPLMRVNGLFYRLFRAPRSGAVKVQLGPGKRSYLTGWINVDANMFTARCDVWADLRYALPFPDASVDVIYSHHVIEHLPDIEFHFQEIHRVLKPGGVFRIGGPNGDSAVKKFLAGDAAWFPDFPQSRTSLGGRLENFIFCRGEHLTILTQTFLEEVAQQAGLVDLKTCLPVKETQFPDWIDAQLLGKEAEPDFSCPHTLIVEGRKAAS